MNTIEVKLVEEFRRDFGITRLVCFAKLGEFNYLVCAPDKMFHVTRFKAPKQYNHSFRVLTFIPELNYIVGIGGGIPNIIILANEPGFPVLSDDYRLPSACYDKIIYCRKANALFVVGSGVEILAMQESRRMFEANPTVVVSNKASLPQTLFGTSSCRVEIDEMRDRFFVSSKCGFSLYSLSGKLIRDMNDLHVLPFQSVCVRNSRDLNKQPVVYPFKMMLTSDANGLVRLWNDSVRVIDSLDDKGTVYVFSQFLNSEFAFMVTSTNKVIVFDVRTKRKVVMCELNEEPVCVDVFRERGAIKCIILTRQMLTEYEVVVPWKLFVKGSEIMTDIRRWPSHEYAARVGMLGNGGLIYLASPHMKEILCSLGSLQKKILSYFYDRGSVCISDQMIQYSQACERVVSVLEDGSVSVYQPAGDKFVETATSSGDVVDMTFVILKSLEKFFVAVLNRGEIVALNFDTMEVEKRAGLTKGVPIRVKYDFEREHLYVFYERKYLVLDAKSLSTVASQEFTEQIIDADIGNGILALGFENGNLKIVKLDDPRSETVLDLDENIQKVTVQYNCVICLTKTNKVFVKGEDASVVEIRSPFPVYCAGFLNPSLDLLLSLGFEIMEIKKGNWMSSLKEPKVSELDSDDVSKEILAKSKSKSTPTGTHVNGVKGSGHAGDDASNDSSDKSNPHKLRDGSDKMARMRKRFQQMKKRAEDGGKSKATDVESKLTSVDSASMPEGNCSTDTTPGAGNGCILEDSQDKQLHAQTGDVDGDTEWCGVAQMSTTEGDLGDRKIDDASQTVHVSQDQNADHANDDVKCANDGYNKDGTLKAASEASTSDTDSSLDDSGDSGNTEHDSNLLSKGEGNRQSTDTRTANSSRDIYASETAYEIKEDGIRDTVNQKDDERKQAKKKKPNKRKKRHTKDQKGRLVQHAIASSRNESTESKSTSAIREPSDRDRHSQSHANIIKSSPKLDSQTKPVSEPDRKHMVNPRLAKINSHPLRPQASNKEAFLPPSDHAPCRSVPVMETLKLSDDCEASILADTTQSIKRQRSIDTDLLVNDTSGESIDSDLAGVPLSQTSESETGTCAVRSFPNVMPPMELPISLTSRDEPAEPANIHQTRSTIDILKPWGAEPSSLPTRPMHIHALNFNRTSVPFARDRGHLQNLPRLRDSRPLGNIELAVKIVRPNVPKR